MAEYYVNSGFDDVKEKENQSDKERSSTFSVTSKPGLLYDPNASCIKEKLSPLESKERNHLFLNPLDLDKENEPNNTKETTTEYSPTTIDNGSKDKESDKNNEGISLNSNFTKFGKENASKLLDYVCVPVKDFISEDKQNGTQISIPLQTFASGSYKSVPKDHSGSNVYEDSETHEPVSDRNGDNCEVEEQEEQNQQRKTLILTRFKLAAQISLILLFFCYFTLALAWNFDKAIPLLVITILVMLWVTRRLLWRVYSRTVPNVCTPCVETMGKRIKSFQKIISSFLGRRYVKMVSYLSAVSAMLIYVIVKNYRNLSQLQPALGLVVIVFFCWLVSYDRNKINWRPVVWGLGLQMALALLIHRTEVGQSTFTFLGRQMEIFLNYVLAGVLFVFGENYEMFFFVFKMMPVMVFLSSVISILYFLGAMQMIINVIAKVMSFTMATTAAETTSTAACLFLGQPEASLTIKPYLELMTRSELFAILTAGFASVSADMFSLFVHYGMPSSHIISAVLMSAPAGMAVSKLICPEVEVSRTKKLDKEQMKMKQAHNIVDAAAGGAQDAISIVASILATIIAFLSIFSFINAVIGYLGSLVNIEDLSLDTLMSYPLMPVTYLMGVAWEDCRSIGEVVGLKTFINELVAYKRLSKMSQEGRIISKRSELIATYALCGFSNPTSVGVALGGLSAMAPNKRKVLANIILMSWLAGCLSCFMTAAWAGLLYQEAVDGAGTHSNVTTTT
ncbi:sodium/nucleoside cotransporter 2 [Aplysia californica]|uniref:Sodium/nucleoside cotransporter 2 n=1 Tax=Aplysia californica TaxID=6500 RepID=A0ABM0K6L8_APLCA|nr:sodium/nucleoside cotransporter 2 [Aplysia californica]